MEMTLIYFKHKFLKRKQLCKYLHGNPINTCVCEDTSGYKRQKIDKHWNILAQTHKNPGII